MVIFNCIPPSHLLVVSGYHRTCVAPVIKYVATHRFSLSPHELWDAVEQFDWFGGGGSWLQEFRIEGDGLRAGSKLYGVVAPPLPYRMRVRIDIIDSVRYESIEAAVHGDLEGTAHLRTREQQGGGTRVEIDWAVEMMQRPMRLANRVAHPLLQWGHDRVVEMTLRGLPKRFGYSGS
jgi:hypothetical protein